MASFILGTVCVMMKRFRSRAVLSKIATNHM